MKLNTFIQTINDQWTDIYYYLHYVHKENITHQAIRLLQYIEKNEEATIGDLAKHLDVSHNTASEHIKRLIQKGYVTKQRSNQDERKVIVLLTEEGSNVLIRHTQLDQEKLRKVVESFSEEELETIQKAFSILSEGARNVYDR